MQTVLDTGTTFIVSLGHWDYLNYFPSKTSKDSFISDTTGIPPSGILNTNVHVKPVVNAHFHSKPFSDSNSR